MCPALPLFDGSLRFPIFDVNILLCDIMLYVSAPVDFFLEEIVTRIPGTTYFTF